MINTAGCDVHTANPAGVFRSGLQVAADSTRRGVSASCSPPSCLMEYRLPSASTSDAPRAYSTRPCVHVLRVRLLGELRGCSVASSASAAMRNVAQRESTSKLLRVGLFCRVHGDLGSLETSVRRGSLTAEAALMLLMTLALMELGNNH